MSKLVQEDLTVLIERYWANGHRGVREAVAEWHRQARECLREAEDGILKAAEEPGQTNSYILEVAQQVRDHREAGNYTTQG